MSVGLLFFAVASLCHARLAMRRTTLLGTGTYAYSYGLVMYDTDHDGRGEIVFWTYQWPADPYFLWQILEYRPVNRYEVVKIDSGVYPYPETLVTGNFIPYEAADLDRDGRTELVGETRYADSATGQERTVLCTIESPDAVSYPDAFNWSRADCNDQSGTTRAYVTDLDQDSHQEVATSWMTEEGEWCTALFESYADNEESLVFCQPPPLPRLFRDFDHNSRADLVTGGYLWNHVLECTGDNQLAEVCSVSTGRVNQTDMHAGEDLDQNGRPEFFTTYVTYPGAGQRFHLYQFEAVAEHEYAYCYVDSSPRVLGSLARVSVCADLDGDGVQELAWSWGTSVRILKAIGPHQYQTVYVWENDHILEDYYDAVCNTADYNRNGYSELYVSGNRKTSILEVEAVRILHPDTSGMLQVGDTCCVRWGTFAPPRCDSVSLFLLTDTVVPQGAWFWNLDTIATGLPPGDTTYPWVVPDTTLAAAWIVAIAYGPGWQFDRSDEPFSIRPAGLVEQRKPTPARAARTPTVVGDVLFLPHTLDPSTPWTLFSTSGRKVMDLHPGPNDIRHVAPGVYFVRTTAGGEREAVTKVIIQH